MQGIDWRVRCQKGMLRSHCNYPQGLKEASPKGVGERGREQEQEWDLAM